MNNFPVLLLAFPVTLRTVLLYSFSLVQEGGVFAGLRGCGD